MTLSPFFAGVAQRLVDIRGVPARSPLFFRDVDMVMAVFTADLAAARALLPSPRLEPLSPFPGKALVAIHCFEYKDTDIGPYNEVSVTIAVRVDRSSRLASMARSTLLNDFQGHIVQLPVTTEIALHGGLDFFNYPKFLANIAFDETTGERRCRATDPQTGALIFAFTSARRPATPTSSPRHYTFRSYPLIDSRLVEARMVVNPLSSTRPTFGRGLHLELGSHPKSTPLTTLRPGRPLQVVHAPRCEAILYEPVGLSGRCGRPTPDSKRQHGSAISDVHFAASQPVCC